jgi:glutamate dehydrogenase (NADP+)
MFGQYKRLRNELQEFWRVRTFFGGSLIRPEAGYGNVYFAQSMLETKGSSFR